MPPKIPLKKVLKKEIHFHGDEKLRRNSLLQWRISTLRLGWNSSGMPPVRFSNWLLTSVGWGTWLLEVCLPRKFWKKETHFHGNSLLHLKAWGAQLWRVVEKFQQDYALKLGQNTNTNTNLNKFTRTVIKCRWEV